MDHCLFGPKDQVRDQQKDVSMRPYRLWDDTSFTNQYSLQHYKLHFDFLYSQFLVTIYSLWTMIRKHICGGHWPVVWLCSAGISFRLEVSESTSVCSLLLGVFLSELPKDIHGCALARLTIHLSYITGFFSSPPSFHFLSLICNYHSLHLTL